MIKANI